MRDCPCCTAFPTKVELSAVIIVIPWLSSHFNVASSLDTKFSQNTTHTWYCVQHSCTTCDVTCQPDSSTSSCCCRRCFGSLLAVAKAASVARTAVPPCDVFTFDPKTKTNYFNLRITSICEKNLSRLWRTHLLRSRWRHHVVKPTELPRSSHRQESLRILRSPVRLRSCSAIKKAA